MRVSVYCSSAKDIPQHSLDLAFEVGVAIGKAGWELVWGGGKASMMGKVAQGARSVGGRTVGVIPQALRNVEFEDEAAHEMHVVENMRTRKAKLEEFFEIWVGRYLKFHNKPIAVCDPIGVYKPLQTALDHLAQQNFMKAGQAELVTWCEDVPSAIRAISPEKR